MSRSLGWRMPEAPRSPTDAGRLFKKLHDDASRGGGVRQIGTLERLEAACTALISGEAYRLGQTMGTDQPSWMPPLRKLNSGMIEGYVRLRQRSEGVGSAWTGPTAVTIRKNPEFQRYVKLREAELAVGRVKTRSDRAALVERALNSIRDENSRSFLRLRLEEWRMAAEELAILKQAIQNLPAISSTALFSDDQRQEGIVDRSLLRSLCARLDDERFLDFFDLENRNGRIIQQAGAGMDLIYPEELAALRQISGIG